MSEPSEPKNQASIRLPSRIELGALGGGRSRWRVEQHCAHLHQPAHDAEALQKGAQVAWRASPKREEKQACISRLLSRCPEEDRARQLEIARTNAAIAIDKKQSAMADSDSDPFSWYSPVKSRIPLENAREFAHSAAQSAYPLSGGALAESLMEVPSLKATSIAFVLRSASQYDDDSKDAIAGLLASHFVKECCDALQSPSSFSGAAHLPALLDACRASLVPRPVAAARLLNALYTACTLKDDVNWTDAIAAADRLLCTGLYKREIVGPVLPRPLADSVRRLRKLLQTREAKSKGPRRAEGVRFDEPSQQWALRAYRLRELDRYSG